MAEEREAVFGIDASRELRASQRLFQAIADCGTQYHKLTRLEQLSGDDRPA